ncbi:ParB-like nuclease family protein [Solirubrobacter pauli]|uniref:ParB-like nuclease family protein n=1 Tax=Solirubrobacter pauli TaxID=166793 RepID=A0A660L5N3_9ACTN|nr:ParB N-terminal domain-containing protein [Solirubrobacter pauli]RKQ86890.1 ParB-like nuclease family protein [Solirubrobacter pauli]
MSAVESLPYGHHLYFEHDEDSTVVALGHLVASKPPASQPDSVATAAARMAEAARGERGRRQPIVVRPLATGQYEIVDGNATYGAALEAKWSDLPVRIQRARDAPEQI